MQKLLEVDARSRCKPTSIKQLEESVEDNPCDLSQPQFLREKQKEQTIKENFSIELYQSY